MITYTVTITTTNPDVTDRVMEACDSVGLDVDNNGRLYPLTVEIVSGEDTFVWGTEYAPDPE